MITRCLIPQIIIDNLGVASVLEQEGYKHRKLRNIYTFRHRKLINDSSKNKHEEFRVSIKCVKY